MKLKNKINPKYIIDKGIPDFMFNAGNQRDAFTELYCIDMHEDIAFDILNEIDFFIYPNETI
jgi:hypothetical protein